MRIVEPPLFGTAIVRRQQYRSSAPKDRRHRIDEGQGRSWSSAAKSRRRTDRRTLCDSKPGQPRAAVLRRDCQPPVDPLASDHMADWPTGRLIDRTTQRL